MSDCPGSCNSVFRDVTARYRAALAAYGEAMEARNADDREPPRPEPPQVRPWRGDPVWCGVCAAKIRARLAELDDAGALLAAHRDGLRGDGDGVGPVDVSREHTSPSPSADDLDEMVSMLTGWECAYRDLMGWPSAPRRGFLATQLSSVTAWLGLHLDGILASGIATDFGTEVGKWHREISAKAGAGPGVRRKPVRCPRCQMMLLTERDGEEYLECGNCGRLLSREEYAEHAAAVAKAAPAA